MEKIGHERTDGDLQLEKNIGRLRSRIEYSDLESISQIGLHQYLDEIIDDVFSFSNKLSKVYFAYH